MATLSLILFIAALVLFVLGAIPVSSRINLVSAGLACALTAYLLSAGIF